MRLGAAGMLICLLLTCGGMCRTHYAARHEEGRGQASRGVDRWAVGCASVVVLLRRLINTFYFVAAVVAVASLVFG